MFVLLGCAGGKGWYSTFVFGKDMRNFWSGGTEREEGDDVFGNLNCWGLGLGDWGLEIEFNCSKRVEV